MAEEQRGIALNDLGVEQLNQLQKQVDQEIQFFLESATTLKMLLARNDKSIQALEDAKEAKPNHTALIPLSESLYVRAELSDPTKNLVEIGTGYFVEIEREKAKAIFERKRENIMKQSDVVEGIMKDKRRTRALISEVFQAKVQSQIENMSMKK